MEKRKRGRQKKRREDNIKEWIGTGLVSSARGAEDRRRWKVVVAKSHFACTLAIMNIKISQYIASAASLCVRSGGSLLGNTLGKSFKDRKIDPRFYLSIHLARFICSRTHQRSKV